MTKKIFALFVIATLMLTTLPGVFAQDAAAPFSWLTECSEDLSGQTINFYHFGDLSARYAFITTPLVAGFTDALEVLNANGGLCGATVEQVFEDTANETERAQAAWDKFTAEDDAYAMFIYNSNDGELLRAQAAEQEMPIFIAAGSEIALYGEENEPGWEFATIPLYTDQLGAFCDFVADPMNAESVGITGAPVIGHLTWPDAFGRSAATPATEAYCESVGVDVVDEVSVFLPDTADLSPLINGLVDAGANIIYTNTLATGPANIVKTIGAMDMENPPIVAGPNWVLDTSVIALGGQDAFGIVGNLPYLWWDELSNPGIQLITATWAGKYLANATTEEDQRTALGLRNIAYLNAWAAVDMWSEIMIQTINRVGSENLSGAAVYETSSNFAYSALQGILEVDWTDGNRASVVTRIGSIQLVEGPNGQTPGILPLSETLPAPDLRAGGADVPE